MKRFKGQNVKAKDLKPVKLIYLVSPGHGGSTLVDMILSAHPQIAGVGELSRFNKDNLCTCQNPLKTCQFWKEMVNKFEINNLFIVKNEDLILNIQRFRYYHENKLGHLLNKSGNFLAGLSCQIYKYVLNKSNATFVIDSSKSLARLTFLVHFKKIKPIIIYLVRDGRGVSWSYIRKYPNRNPLKLMWIWFKYHIISELIMKRYNFKKIFVRYEDFVDDPAKCLKKILGSLGLKYLSDMLRYKHREQHQVGGNRMKFNDNESIIKDISWKKMLPRKYKIIFIIFFGWLNYYYQKFKK